MRSSVVQPAGKTKIPAASETARSRICSKLLGLFFRLCFRFGCIRGRIISRRGVGLRRSFNLGFSLGFNIASGRRARFRRSLRIRFRLANRRGFRFGFSDGLRR